MQYAVTTIINSQTILGILLILKCTFWFEELNKTWFLLTHLAADGAQLGFVVEQLVDNTEMPTQTTQLFQINAKGKF